jgi:hypothetical protein
MRNSQLEHIKNETLGMAKFLLAKHKEFYPFGFVQRTSAEIQLVQISDGTEQPQSKVLLDLLQDQMTSQASKGEISSCAICWNCLVALNEDVSKKRDAIAIHLEGFGAEPVVVFIPYEKRFIRSPRYLEPFYDGTSVSVFQS